MVSSRRLWPYRLDLRTPFRGLTQRRGCLIAGSQGWGEFAPFDDYDAEADARWLACALEQADGRWPARLRDGVEVNAIIPAVAPDAAARMAVESGCRTIKVKVGDRLGLARAQAVRDAVPGARLRVDVNGGWTVPEAVRYLREFADLDLEYAEQPVRTYEQMARLRDMVDVPLAADEVIRIDRRFDDVSQVADVAVLKVAPLGGVASTLDAARRVGLPVVVSSALDTSLGLAASVAAACSLEAEPLACGLGTGALFAEDTTEIRLIPAAGRMRAGDPPDPRPDLPVASDDLAYWRRRIRKAADLRGTVDQ
ncbi:MAG: o-succinylbenzoate synthase [Candidatus Nanopelagicales bacterium]